MDIIVFEVFWLVIMKSDIITLGVVGRMLLDSESLGRECKVLNEEHIGNV